MKLKLFQIGFVFTLFASAIAISLWVAGLVFVGSVLGIDAVKSDVTPLTWLQYYAHYKGDAGVFGKLKYSGSIGLSLFGILMATAVIIALKLRNTTSVKQHGDAKFGKKRDLKKAKLLEGDGIIVGKSNKELLRFPGNEFVFLSAPTRGGKGVSVVIPNCLEFDDSMVVMDVKGENQEITSKYRRSKGQEVYCFNPFDADGKTHRYNPLYYIRKEQRYRVGDLTQLGYMIYPKEGEHAFFQNTARNLFVGLGLYLMETAELPTTIGEMLRQASGKGRSPAEHFVHIIETREAENRGLSAQCADSLNRYLSANEELQASIMQSFLAPLLLFADTMFDAATSECDFDFKDLRKKRMTIYFGIPVRKMEEATLLINLFWSQLISTNTEELPSQNPELKHKVVLMMDEMPSMGRVSVIAKGSAFIAGYNLRLVTIVQSPQQLYANPPEGYGQQVAKSIIANHSCKMIFTPDELSDAEELSKLIGTYTYQSKSTSVGQGKKQNFGITKTGTVSDSSRALMMPQELREMPFSEHLLFIKGMTPFKVDKVTYFNDSYFTDMFKTVSPSLNNIKNKIPTQAQFEKAWSDGELMIDIPPMNISEFEAKAMGLKRDLELSDIDNIDGGSIVLNDDPFDGLSNVEDLDEDECLNVLSKMNDAMDHFAVSSETSEYIHLPTEARH